MPPKPLGPPPKFGASPATGNNSNTDSYRLPQPPNEGSLFLRGAQGTPPSKKIVRARILNPNTAASALEVVIAPAMAQSLAKDITFDPRGCFIDVVTDQAAMIPAAAMKQPEFQRDTCFKLVRQQQQQQQPSTPPTAWPQGLSEIPLKAHTRMDRNSWIKYFVDLGAIARDDASIALLEAKQSNNNSEGNINSNSNANLRSGGASRTNSGRSSRRNSTDRLEDYDYGEDEEEEDDDDDEQQQQQQLQQLQQKQQQQQQQQNGSINNSQNRFGSINSSSQFYGSATTNNSNNNFPAGGSMMMSSMMHSSNSVPITRPKRPAPPHTLVIPQIKIEDLTSGETLNFQTITADTNITTNNQQQPESVANVSFASSTALFMNNNNNVVTSTTTTPSGSTTTHPNVSSPNKNNNQQQQQQRQQRPDPTSFWPKVTTASTAIYRSIRAPANAQLWRENHTYIYNYSDRPSLPPVDWTIQNNNNNKHSNNNNNSNDDDEDSNNNHNEEQEEYFYPSLLPPLDVVAHRACLEALHTASSILFNADPNSSATAAMDLNDEDMMRLKQKQHSSQEQQKYRERQLFLQRQQKLAFGIPWNEDVETIKRALEQVQLGSVDIAYDLIRKARHSCDDPRRKPVKCVAVLCDINRFTKSNNTNNNNTSSSLLPSYIVQAGQAGLQITDDAVILRGPSFDFSCLKGEIKNVEGGGGSTMVGAGSDGGLRPNCCSSSTVGSVLEQICLSEFPKWMPHSEYSFLLDEDEKSSSSPSSSSSSSPAAPVLKELPSTVIVRVLKKQVNAQYQQFLTIEEELDLHLVLMFKWPVRADTAAKAFNDFWLRGAGAGAGNTARDFHIMNNKPYQICPIPQKNTRVNQAGASLFGFVESELFNKVLSPSNMNSSNNKTRSTELLRERQAEREPDFESMQKWTMLDFYATKKRQVI